MQLRFVPNGLIAGEDISEGVQEQKAPYRSVQ